MLDSTFVTLLDGYLNSAAARTAGMPATSVCPVLKMDSQADKPDPCLVITVEEQGEGRIRQMQCLVTLHSQLDRSTTDAYLDAALTRLRDRVAWETYLAATSIDLRTGYQIEAVSVPAAQSAKREDTGATETSIATTFYLTLPPI
jgi:hypothetical protein